MDQIVEITVAAKDQINNIFDKESKNREEDVLRLSVVGGGCSGLSYKIDFGREKEKDKIFSYENFKVAIDIKSSIYLKGVTLDFSDGLDGKGFKFVNPNASNTCGCGESFSV